MIDNLSGRITTRRKIDMMDQLTPEIIHVICSFLDLKSVRNFRLTCRAYGDIAACYGLQELVFYLHHQDLQALKAISSHPIVSKNVKSLVYVAHTLEMDAVDFDDFVGLFHETRRARKSYKRRETIHPCGTRFHDRSLTRSELKAAYKTYINTISQQARILGTNEDFAVLEEVIPRLTGLREIVISSDFWERHNSDYKTPFDSTLLVPVSDLKPQGCRQLKSILAVLGKSETRLRKLAVGSVDWRLFSPRDNCLTQALPWLSNLTVLEFAIDTGIREPTMFEDGELGYEVLPCREMMQRGVLRKFISSLKHLTGLYIEFNHHSTDHGYPASLADIIETGHCWPNLASLSLGNIECERQDLTAVLELHKSTLKHLCLTDLCLLNTSWKRLLPDIRQTLQLETAWVCGEMKGCDENSDPPVEESWNGGYMERGLGTEVGLAIEDYLLRDGEMPLTDKNMSWPEDDDELEAEHDINGLLGLFTTSMNVTGHDEDEDEDEEYDIDAFFPMFTGHFPMNLP